MNDRQDLSSKAQLIRELATSSQIDVYWRRFLPLGQFSCLGVDSGLEEALCVELIAIVDGEILSDIGVHGREAAGVFMAHPRWITCHDPRPMDEQAWENKVIVSDGERWSIGRQWGRSDTMEQHQELVRLSEVQDMGAPDLVLSEKDQELIGRRFAEYLAKRELGK